jgi:ubiquinone/menaquinone biosynthesis C-methylase UbiE
METAPDATGKFLDPNSIIGQLDIAAGSIVADFGCGPGSFSLPLAKAVGKKGIVYSFDVLPQALESVEGRAKAEGISNIKTARVNLEKKNGSGLEDDSLDWVIMKDVLFQNKKKEIIAAEAYRVLKNGGKALVVEWKKKHSLIGPETDVRISDADVKEIFDRKNFVLEKTVNPGDYHYAFVFRKE